MWRRSDERVFEYACHEGNYALGGILRGPPGALQARDAHGTVAAGHAQRIVQRRSGATLPLDVQMLVPVLFPQGA